MVHNVVQPDFIDSLATTHEFSYLLDMFSSPFFQPQEQQAVEEAPQQLQQQQQEMTTEETQSSKKYSNEETLNRTKGQSESLYDNVDMNGSGSVQAPDHSKDTLATKTKPPQRPRQKGLTWTPAEHELFLEGVEKYGRGDWKSISKTFVLSRTPAQVASHAQKYFGHLKRGKKPGTGCRGKSMATDSPVLPNPIVVNPIIRVPPLNYAVVHPTFYVPQSGKGNDPPTFLNPPADFQKVPLTFTNHTPLAESRKVDSTLSFPSTDSFAAFALTNPFPPLKFAKVLPTIYAPPSNSSRVRVYPTVYVPPSKNDPSGKDVYQPSTDFITNPTSDNTIIHPTNYILPCENKYSDPDLYIPSPNFITAPSSTEINVHPTISVPQSIDTPINPDVYFPSLNFLDDPCLASINVPSTNLVSPLNSLFTDPDENPTLDFLDAPPLNNNDVVHDTIQVPPSDTKSSDPTLPLPQNDFGYVQPVVSDLLLPEYYPVNHTDSFTPSATIPISPYNVAYMEQMFVEQHFLHQNRGFMEFKGM